MFVYKKTEELEAMTVEQLDAYKVELKSHEDAEIKKGINSEVEKAIATAKEALKVSLTAEIENQITDKMTSNENGKSTQSLSEQLKENREQINSILKGDRSVEVVVKADTLRASIVGNTEAVRLTDIGQLGVKRRALYDYFTKIPMGNGNNNGTIAYIDWDEATTVRAAAAVAEGVAFAESTAKFAEYTKKLVKVGDTLPVSEEFGEDEVLAAAELRNFLNINVSTIIDQKIAVGAGGADIEGLYTASPTYVPVASTLTDANIKDLVRKMRTAIVKTRGSKYQPDFVAANSDTIDRYFLKKDANNNYMFDAETGMIAGLAVVEDNNLADNTLVVGDGRFGRIYEKAGVVLSEGMSGTQFVADMKTIKARARLLFLIRNVDKTGFLKSIDITANLATLASTPI